MSGPPVKTSPVILLAACAVSLLGLFFMIDDAVTYHDWLTGKCEGALGFGLLVFGGLVGLVKVPAEGAGR